MVVLVALLLDFRGFRKFATHPGPEGTASLGDLFSIRGSIVVLLTLALVLGVLSPLLLVPLRQNDGDEIPSSEIEQSKEKNLILHGNIRELKAKIKELGTTQGILNTVKELKRDVLLTDRLVEMAERQEGPWSLPESEELTASISGEIEKGFAAACSAYHKEYLEIIGSKMGRTVKVYVKTLIYKAADCREKIDFDLKLSCPDARHIFPGDSVLERCDGLIPEWREKAEFLTVHAVVVKGPGP